MPTTPTSRTGSVRTAPDAVAERQEQRDGHGPSVRRACRPPSPSLVPIERRLDHHHIDPRDPQRHAARPGEVGPLDHYGGVGERGAEAEPWEGDVALVADQPLKGGPRDGEPDPERDAAADRRAGDQPEQAARVAGQDDDGDEVPEGRQRREVPQGDGDPVEQQALRGGAVGEPPAEGAGRIAHVHGRPEQHDRRRDGDEGERGQLERRVAPDEQQGTRDGEQRGPAAAHSTMSRPSSAER
jgi:hypothetical protein